MTAVPTGWGAEAAFDRRLDRSLASPVAVAFSGGGDSLAALIATLEWAKAVGRPVVAVTVDHRLQPSSAHWTAFAEKTAVRLGAGFRGLVWEGEKPDRGVAAAARLARHRLIAEAARDIGAGVVVFGHIADDLMEAALMRTEGASLGDPREWSPSPVWPEGRGVFLLRPLLGMRRAALREALRAKGETWIDDPANENMGSLRARARLRLANSFPLEGEEAPQSKPARGEGEGALLRQAQIDAAGCIQIARSSLRGAPSQDLYRFLAAAVVCVGGGTATPRGDRVGALISRLVGDSDFTATLAGAKVRVSDLVTIVRNAGEAARGGLAPLSLAAGRAGVWDGRFCIAADVDLEVRALAGAASRLDPASRTLLRALPAASRPGLPVIRRSDGDWTCPILAETPGVRVFSLVSARLLAACGAISREPATEVRVA